MVMYRNECYVGAGCLPLLSRLLLRLSENIVLYYTHPSLLHVVMWGGIQFMGMRCPKQAVYLTNRQVV